MISVSIMAHSSRSDNFDYLREKLNDPPFAIDQQGQEIGVWENAKRAWKLYDPEAEYHVVVQDDIIIGKGFLERAEQLMKHDVIYNFYMGKRPRFRREIEQAKAKNKRFIIKTNLHHECCFGMRTERIDEMIKYCDSLNPKSDRVINKYINKEKLMVFFTMPSLVSHRKNQSLHMLNRGSYPTGARWFIGE